MQITREFAKYQLIPVTFFQANVAADQTDAQIKDASGQVEGLSMAFAGEVLAVSVDLSAAATAGSLAVGVTKGGTEAAATVQTLTTAAAATKAFPRGTMTFAAGDKLGVEITTSATWDGTTADLVVTVLVALAVEGV
jgi:hypothetical protein